jgi:acetyl esterase
MMVDIADPQVARLLKAREAANLPAVTTLTAATARATREEWRRAHVGPPIPISIVKDGAVPGLGRDLRIRTYADSKQEPLCLIVFFHGGGWVLGDLEQSDSFCRAICVRSGATVVSVDYRLAPENPYPAAFEDALAATEWIAASHRTFGCRAPLIVLCGSSAGGNLAAAVTLASRDRGNPRLTCQVLICPVLDRNFDTPSYREYANGPIVTRDEMRWYWQQYFPHDHDPPEFAAPLRAENLQDLPPSLIVSAELDPLRSEAEAFAEALTDAGGDVEYECYPGMIHAFAGMVGALDAAQSAVDRICGFIEARVPSERTVGE